MSDDPLVPNQGEQQEAGEQKPANDPELLTRDLIHEAAEDRPETHSEKRKKYREEILNSLPKNQNTDDKSPEEIYQDQIKKSHGKINAIISDMWENTISHLWYTSGHEATEPTKITDNGTKIYVLDQFSSVSSLIAHNPGEQEVYQMIQLPPIDGKVKIVGLLYSPNGFEMAEIEMDSEDFENESIMRAFIDPSDEDAKDKFSANAPILKYFDELSAQLHSPDQSLPFFVSQKDVRFLTEIYFPYLSDHPDVLSGPVPDFNSIKASLIEPKLPQGNDPESVKAREIHFALEGLVGDIEEAFNLAALERPGSNIQFFNKDNKYKEIRYGNQFRTYFLIRWSSEENLYEIFKHPQDRPDIDQSFSMYTQPGKPIGGSFNGDNKEFLYDFHTFVNDLRKTLRQEAESS